MLLARIREQASRGMKEESYGWYLDLRRFGGVEHSGFGMGFERMMMYLTGMKNIRDVIPFPRTPGNAEFLVGQPLPNGRGSARGPAQSRDH